MLVQGGDIFLIARQAIEGFGNDDVKKSGARVFEQLLVARSHADRAAHGVVGVDTSWQPPFHFDARLAEADLIVDRRLALKIGRVSCVDCGAHVTLPWNQRGTTQRCSEAPEACL